MSGLRSFGALILTAFAAAFNSDKSARKYLNEAITSNSSVATVKETREILAHLYAREAYTRKQLSSSTAVLAKTSPADSNARETSTPTSTSIGWSRRAG